MATIQTPCLTINCRSDLAVPSDRPLPRVTCPGCRTSFDWRGSSEGLSPRQKPRSVLTLFRPRRHDPPDRPRSSAGEGFLAGEFEKFGRSRQVKHAPDAADCITLPFYCSDNGAPFLVTMARDRPGEPYHLKSLESSYEKLLRASGYALELTPNQRLEIADSDFGGFQCAICGAGRCVGNRDDWLLCRAHNIAFCGNRVEAIHGGGWKARCPLCREWRVIDDTTVAERLDGVGFNARKAQSNPPPSAQQLRNAPETAPRLPGIPKLLK